MDRRGFLKGAVAISGTVLGPSVSWARETLAYVGHCETNVGAPGGTSCWFGKHTQWAYCSADGKLYAYGGDGDWRLADTGFKQQQSLNSVLSYDFAKNGLFKQETLQHGRKIDGTAPYFHDGCTWVYNSQEDRFYAIPGYQPAPVNPARDPHGIMKAGVVHMFNRKTGAWEEGPATAGNWIGEHWGGFYDSKRNRVWINCASGGETGGMRWFDCATRVWGKAGLKRTPGLSRARNIGHEVITNPWAQKYNPLNDEALLFDGYRGLIIAVNLESLQPRIITTVPAIRGDVAGEPIGTIETGVAFSVRRQKMFISYSHGPQYVVGGVGDIVAVDLDSGATERVPYPAVAGEMQQWTQAEYDDTSDCLILAAYISGVGEWKHRFLQYRFSGRRV